MKKEEVDILRGMISPQNTDAEQLVLGTILLTESLPAELLKVLSASDFYRDAHKTIFSDILVLAEKNKPISLPSLFDYLGTQEKLEEIGGASYLAHLTDCIPEKSNLIEYAKSIREKAIRRNIIAISSEIASNGYDEKISLEELLAKLNRKIDELLSSAIGTTSAEITSDFGSLMSSFVSTETHLPSLNSSTGGLPNDLTVILGQTSMGKTSLGLGFLQKILFEERKPVAYFGPQIKPKDIFFRIICSQLQIPASKIMRGNLTKEKRNQAEKIHRQLLEKKLLNIYTMDKRMSVMDITITAKALAEKGNLGYVQIDNLQQLIWPEKIAKRNEELELITGALKKLGNDLQIPVVVSSQIIRDVDKREDRRPLPSDSDAAGTSEIERLARLVLCLYRDDFYHPETVKKEQGWRDAEISVFKNGPPTILGVKFNPTTLSWQDKN